MARIKVTGYLDTDTLDPDYVALNDDSGLSHEGYTQFHRDLSESGLEDLEFEVED